MLAYLPRRHSVFSATITEFWQHATDSAVTVDNRTTFLRKILSSVICFRFIRSGSLQQPKGYKGEQLELTELCLQVIIAGAQAEYSLVRPRTVNTSQRHSVRRSVSSAVYQSLVIALVLTRLN